MDSRIQQQIPILLEMARDRSDEGRVALVEKLSDIFLNRSASLTPREEHLVNELIEELLHTENPGLRQALIAKFDQAVHCERPIALRIIQGPVEIARKILACNENLRDDDLISVIKNKSVDHATAIATRREISEAVADALVTTGSIKIMQIVAENMGAKLSVQAIDILVDTARLASLLQKPLFSRPELPQEKALQLYWWTSKELRRTALDRFGFGPGRLDSALGKAIDQKLKTHIFEKDDMEAMASLADWLEERDALTTKILPQLLRLSHYRLFNIAMSRLCCLDLELIDAISNSKEPRLLVALCRGINIDKGSFVSIFLMSRGGRNDDQVVNPRELSVALETFDRVSPEAAQGMLQHWREEPLDLIQRVEQSTEKTA